MDLPTTAESAYNWEAASEALNRAGIKAEDVRSELAQAVGLYAIAGDERIFEGAKKLLLDVDALIAAVGDFEDGIGRGP